MMPNRPQITSDTRVAALLRDFPETEELLIAMSPAFKKLRNPVLRRSVARAATLGQAAAVGRLPAAELVNELRVAVGQDPLGGDVEDETEYFGVQPDWFSPEMIAAVLRDDELDPDVMPINPLLRVARDLEEGEIVELVTSHLPAPGIDILRGKGYRTWTIEGNQAFRTYVSKMPAS